MDKKTEAFYTRLKTELAGSTQWPAEYLFKFIVPTEEEKIVAIESAFNDLGAVISTQQSKNGTYTSISVNVQLDGPEVVIEKYLAVSTIEGIISL